GRRWRENIEAVAGVSLSIGSEALAAALEALGGIRRVALISPYFPVANTEVRRFLADYGFETVRDTCLRCPSWTAIAEVAPDRLEAELDSLDGDDVDAIVQVGTNLSMLELAAQQERQRGKPVVAINAATYWHALRANGITDAVSGYGNLLEKH
ncbi:MAG: arylmalonate decarboxylase, partial [Pseudomonadota bacterium]